MLKVTRAGLCCPAAAASKLAYFSDFLLPLVSASEDFLYFFADPGRCMGRAADGSVVHVVSGLKWTRGSESPDCPLQPDAPVCGRPCSAWTSARSSSICGDSCVLALLHVDLSRLRRLLAGCWTATLPAGGVLASGAMAVRRVLRLRVVSHVSPGNAHSRFFLPHEHSVVHVTCSRGVWSAGGNRQITVALVWATKVS